MISKELENKFIEVAICIRSGQVEPRQIVEYMNLQPKFEQWYKDRYIKKHKTTVGALYHP
tara:strand:- start:10329 stop:10508 length:180 start_codon:yes stop_codon:yes gene_type:complete